MKKRGKVIKIISGILVVLAVVLAIKFNLELKKASERFETYQNKAETVETSYGRITYIDEGEGEVILSCHGICGGYDQAYDTLSDKTDNYRVIAPSRFGYPGSDVAENPSIDSQVETFVELLDTLNIDKVYVLGTSAGGAVAIKFALLHPERTKGLILYCSGYPATQKPANEATYVGPPAALCYDFPMWFFSPLFEPLMGMDSDTIGLIMPLSERHDGIVLDAKIANTDMDNHYEEYDMSKLSVPVLIVHAEDDKLADYSKAALWSEKIPNCTFVSCKTGGHLMTGNSEKIDEAFNRFIHVD
ncbi:MAG: alpha/beta hydrolase [Acetobacterium woodii]|nr:alpha/beta hydrolase [Acetobacterium woodii]